MSILDVLRGLWIREQRLKKLRKEMRMTRKCTRELDILLASFGLDFSNFELCPISVENEDKNERGDFKNGSVYRFIKNF